MMGPITDVAELAEGAERPDLPTGQAELLSQLALYRHEMRRQGLRGTEPRSWRARRQPLRRTQIPQQCDRAASRPGECIPRVRSRSPPKARWAGPGNAHAGARHQWLDEVGRC